MTIKKTEKTVKLDEIKANNNNPRQIKQKEMDRLKKSLKDFPEMMKLRPIVVDENGVILGGNMRYQALVASGADEADIIQVEGLTEAQKREFIIKDNVPYGEWNWDALANEWDTEELNEWGLSLPGDEIDFDNILEEASLGSIKDYTDDTDFDAAKFIRKTPREGIKKELEEGVKNGEIRPEVEAVCRKRIEQSTIFNFDEITKFYRSEDATEAEKKILEDTYMVFITSKEAVEKGLARINKLSGIITGNLFDETEAEAEIGAEDEL